MKKLFLGVACFLLVGIGLLAGLGWNEEDKSLEDKRLEDQRLERQRVDEHVQDQRLEQQRIERKLDDDRWNRAHQK